MRKDKNLAIKLRWQSKSYNEISKILGVPKSTLSGWFKNDPKSQQLKLRLGSKSNPVMAKRIEKFVKINREKWDKLRRETRLQAIKEFPKLVKNSLFIAGLMLYWGEGDSNPKNPVRLTNTNPKMIRLYTKFLIEIIKIPKEKIRVALILYPDLSEKQCLNFWSKINNLPKSQFLKTQFIRGRHPTRRLLNGICMIILNSRHLKEKFLIWIDLLSKTL